MGSIPEFEDDFPVKKILKILDDKSVYKYWKLISIKLKISLPVIEKLHLDLLLEKKMYADVLEDILLIWQMQYKNEATLEALIKLLGDQSDIKSITDKLKELTQKRATAAKLTDIKWNQLDLDTRRYVLTKEVQFLGTRRSLASIAANLNEIEFTKTLRTHLNDKILDNILQKTGLEIAKNTVPDQVLYYIPRTLLLRTEVKPDIFESSDISDIFLIKDVERSYLSDITKFHGSDISSNQIEQVTSTFILLEFEQHFEQICNLTKKPVHYIRFKNNKFIWVKTRGNIDTILKHINKNEEFIQELDLINERFENHNVSTICIADSPGMGKSVLLANLARIVQMRFPERITIFMYMSELIILTKSSTGSSTAITSMLAKKLSENEFGRQLLLNILSSRKYHIEMFIDGFDEILPEDEIHAKKILLAIKELQNIRLCITTRQNLQHTLESSFGVISYNIKPFTNPEKVDFFSEYWNRKYSAQMTNALIAYSQSCLPRFDNKMEQYIAGVPLQCRLLAETLASEAEQQSVREFTNNRQSSEILSLLNLFKKQMVWYFRCENSEQISFYKNIALTTVFPKSFPDLDWSVGQNGDVMDFSRKGFVPRFVHRCYAEYILASDVLEIISNPIGSLSSKPDIHRVFAIRYTTKSPTEFLNPGLCIFLDAMILEQNVLQDSHKIAHLQNFIRTICLKDDQNRINFIKACAFHQTYGLLCSIFDDNEGIQLSKVISQSELQNLLQTAIQHAKLDMVEKCCKMIDPLEDGSFPLLNFENLKLMNIKLTPLHVAIERGCFKTFEFFVKVYKEKFNEMVGLLHVAAHNSHRNSNHTITEKMEMMKLLLLKEDKMLLIETIAKNHTPLLMDRIHIDLIKFLIDRGADAFARTSNLDNMGHFAGSYMNAEDYHALVEYLAERELDSILRYKNSNHEAAYQVAIRHIKVYPETVEMLARSLSVLADAEHVYQDSLLYHLVKHGYKAPALNAALKHPSSWECLMYRDGSTSLLHVAAYWANLDAIEYFLENGADVNTEDNEWRTPLHIACDRGSDKMLASEMSKVRSLLIFMGANVNATDNKGRKPLENILDKVKK